MATTRAPGKSSKRGSYYKARSKKFLESTGWQVAFLERMMPIFQRREPSDGSPVRQLFTKRDQLGSDLLAVKADAIAFVQVKMQATPGGVAKAVHAFREFTFPPFAQQVVHVWRPGASAPDVVDATTYVIRQGRKAPAEETLF